MNKDRGTIKWTALMLPEHIAKLHEWRKDSNKVLPIEKQDWQLADIEQALQQSYYQKQTITLTAVYLEELQVFTGIVTAIRTAEQQITLQLPEYAVTLSLDSIHTAAVDDFYD